MQTLFYVVRQRNGWSVERGRIVQSAHADQDAAIQRALNAADVAYARGEQVAVRVQEDAGGWREARSFAPEGRPFNPQPQVLNLKCMTSPSRTT